MSVSTLHLSNQSISYLIYPLALVPGCHYPPPLSLELTLSKEREMQYSAMWLMDASSHRSEAHCVARLVPRAAAAAVSAAGPSLSRESER